MAEGIIYKAMSGFYYVKSMEGTAECRARGRFRLEKSIPLVGDYVEYAATEPGKGILTNILPRKNAFLRPPLANIDKMIIFASNAIPVTDTYLIDRMTTIAVKSSCEPVICINKIDIDPANLLFSIYKESGFVTLRCSAKTGEGREELLETIKGSVCAFTGNSGVGKSSILNLLEPGFRISVGDISRKLGRGRHTTRHVELFDLPFGAVIADTPGFSAFDAGHLAKGEKLQFLFRDFEPYLGNCRFLDCVHVKEPGCAVLDAIEEGKIKKTRHDSYVRLYRQALDYKEWEHN